MRGRARDACTASMYGYSCCHSGWSRPRATTMCGEQPSGLVCRGWQRLVRIGPDLKPLRTVQKDGEGRSITRVWRVVRRL